MILKEYIELLKDSLLKTNKSAEYVGNEIVTRGPNCEKSDYIVKSVSLDEPVTQFPLESITEEVKLVKVKFDVIAKGKKKPFRKDYYFLSVQED